VGPVADSRATIDREVSEQRTQNFFLEIVGEFEVLGQFHRPLAENTLPSKCIREARLTDISQFHDVSSIGG